MHEGNYQSALGELRQRLAQMQANPDWQHLIQEEKAGVLGRFAPLLARDHIPNLTEAEIRPFFYIEHNKHWSSLYRQVNRVCGNMPFFRKALLLLTDETRPIEDRYDEVAGLGLTGMGRAIMTGLLTIAFPASYGVWNTTTEEALDRLGLKPDFSYGTTAGNRYRLINDLLQRLCEDLGIDFWTLDTLWWTILKDGKDSPSSDDGPDMTASSNIAIPQSFGLERHLHLFMRDNWAKTDLGKDWAILDEPDNPEVGYEYYCGHGIGRIDFLCRHRSEPRWLVVELKRGASSDQAVGQVLRYMGWVTSRLAKPSDTVEGLIIAHSADKALRYAVSAVPNLSLRTYHVDFALNPAALEADD